MDKRTLFITTVILSGCSLAPRYQRPAAPVPEQWPATPSTPKTGVDSPSANHRDATVISWREYFTDARLQRLIDLALHNNRDLRAAVLNVEAVRQQYRIERAAWLPTIAASGGANRQHTPAALSASGHETTSTQYSVGLAVTSFEIDLFGRIRSLSTAALEQYFAAEENRRAAQLAIVSEVAISYLGVREAEEQLAVAKQTLEAAQSSFNLTQESFKVGTVSELDVRSAETQVDSARADMAAFTRARAQAENRLAMLVGAPFPSDLPAAVALDDQRIMTDLPAGVPSEVLTRRPDVLAAEHQLRAANADIGAARSAFFPSISLTGGVGRASLQLSDLYNSAYNTWNFAPRLNLPIFTGGSNRAALRVAETVKEIRVANYEGAIQTAFREVADALAARATLDEQIAATEARVSAERRRFELAQMQYREGISSFLELLTAQQSLYAAQQILIQSRFARLQNLVTLYQVLGGGWNS